MEDHQPWPQGEKDHNTLLRELDFLKAENAQLKELLRVHGIVYISQVSEEEKSNYSNIAFPDAHLGKDERVALFCNLFRGRTDVFARRWYSKATGKSGYQPVCANEWRRGICNKKLTKCTDCPNRSFQSLGYNDICNHLIGSHGNSCDVVGIYAILPNNNCMFLCTDFDDKNCIHNYKEDVHAFTSVCKDWGIPYSIERSRSGHGAHAWIFFENETPAYKARRLGNAILTEAMERDGRMSFNSYDRFFPSQDRMPEGGFGNLVALPLQGKARKKLNSVFVDDDFLAYKDQWSYLFQVKKLDESTVDTILQQHRHEDLGVLSTSSEAKPWIIPIPQDITHKDFKETISITIADKIYIPLHDVSAKAVNHMKRIAAFRNPDFYTKQAMRMSTYGIPRIISCFDITDDYLAMPRGCKEAIFNFLDTNNVKYSFVDKTNHGVPISVSFTGTEREEQLDAITALTKYDCGVLHATTAFGKTVIAASIIAQKKVNTLILVHTKALLDQWHKQLSEFLRIDYDVPTPTQQRGRKHTFSPIGCLDSTKNTLHGIIDIALIQSCIQNGDTKSFIRDYGLVIVDECHHVSSVTFETVMKNITAHTTYGLTATPIRKDGHQPIIFMQLGPIRFKADAKAQMARQTFQRVLIPRFTSYRDISEEKKDFATVLKNLSQDEIRNNLITEDVFNAVSHNRTPIVITRRIDHMNTLYELISKRLKNVICLSGKDTTKEKRMALESLQLTPTSEALVIIATEKYIGEGFDYPRLDTLFLAMPIAWKGMIQQCAGRLHRENEGKKDVRIYDYIDMYVPMLNSMYHKRLRGYAAIGYRAMAKESPTLFDDITDIEASSSNEQIFNGSTFLQPFVNSLNEAKCSIIISSPKVYLPHRSILPDLLKELSVKGIEIVILTAEEGDIIHRITTHGLRVKIVMNLSICGAIIDKSIVWYGDINPLGYNTEENNILKMQDSKLANELLNVLLSDTIGLHGN
jgi:superfamily II DNA or RNA helicase